MTPRRSFPIIGSRHAAVFQSLEFSPARLSRLFVVMCAGPSAGHVHPGTTTHMSACGALGEAACVRHDERMEPRGRP